MAGTYYSDCPDPVTSYSEDQALTYTPLAALTVVPLKDDSILSTLVVLKSTYIYDLSEGLRTLEQNICQGKFLDPNFYIPACSL